ncbi:hypothetical protein WOLCODRAFT_163035 [Wolfiporia cocos MD-104 SS10]|uniref:WKF domain-containing protein n=1 Tax=Wolfiporia cocos (strain MD-104) TaxID=742152 RepID=A0A2H3JXB5_WOLCO|nr:hypothetical protein WOLCODRAFT_163035 [Wolfiporia cocos MD-104 SS10]
MSVEGVDTQATTRKSKKSKVKHDHDAKHEPTVQAKSSDQPVEGSAADTKKHVKKSKRKKETSQVDAPEVVADDADRPDKLEKKSKRRQKEVDTVVDSASPDTAPEGKPKKEKKKKRNTAEISDAIEPVALENLPKESTQDAVAEGAGAQDEAVEDGDAQKTRKKKRSREKDTSQEAEVQAGTEEKKKKRKEKRKWEETTADAQEDAREGKGRREKKRKTGSSELPDPSEDESLSEQACKALSYAFTQFDDPSKWKFNKARQNWLIRNVWSSTAIPDTYMPLLTRYFTGVKGGVRDALIKTCQDAVSAPLPSEPVAGTKSAEATKSTEKETATTVDSSNNTSDQTKRNRATTLLAQSPSEGNDTLSPYNDDNKFSTSFNHYSNTTRYTRQDSTMRSI